MRAIFLVIAALALGCAPLIDFDTLSAGDDAGGDGTITLDASGDGGMDASTDASTDMSATDVLVASCKDANDGFFCGNDPTGPQNYPNSSDLVTCVKGNIVGAQSCDGGCIIAPYYYPDTCDECAGKRDGVYCGSEFAGYRNELRDVKFQCHSGSFLLGSSAPCATTPGGTPHCIPNDGGGFCN